MKEDTEEYFKVEGNIIYPNNKMLTWGPFYYHSFKNAKKHMKHLLKDIQVYCHSKAVNVMYADTDDMIVFDINALDEEDGVIKKCQVITSVDNMYFQD